MGTEGVLNQDVPSGSGEFLVTRSSAILDASGLKPSGSCSFGSYENRSSHRNAESREKILHMHHHTLHVGQLCLGRCYKRH